MGHGWDNGVVSSQNPFGTRGRMVSPTLPRGEIVMTYDTYQAAQQAVDVLARADFPVDQLSIVGSDLKSVERVTGKLSWGRVAVAGAASGAWLGMFFGLLLVIFSSATSIGFVLAAILIGAGFGMLFGVASYGINRRRRDFTSVMQVIATSYSVIADHELGNRARNVLQSRGEPGEPWSHPSDPPLGGAGFGAGGLGGQRPAGGPGEDGERPGGADGAGAGVRGDDGGGTHGGGREPAGDGTGSARPPRERPRYGENLDPEDEEPGGPGENGDDSERRG